MRAIKKSAVICFVLFCAFKINVFSIKHSEDKHYVAARPDSNGAVISVDCANPRNMSKSMVGFLLSVSPSSPSSKLITDLGPKYWRLSSRNSQMLDRINSFGATPIFLMSDVFKYPVSHGANWRPAHEAVKDWKDTVKSVIKQHNSEGRMPIYDLWNEPNGKQFWSGTQEQFFSTFKAAHDQVRKLKGAGTMISGPSISNFDINFLQNFLDYCLQNKITLNILSWHEFQAGDNISKVSDDIALAKARFVNNPKYAPLKIKSIQINEIIPATDQFAPGSILAYFSYLEKSGVDASCKACWVESNGKSNCFNNSLDGLIDITTSQPRAAWWAYKYYNLSLKNRLRYTSNNSHIVCLPNYQDNKLKVLMGYYGTKGKNADSMSVQVNLTHVATLAAFASKTSVSVKVTSIPDSGEAPLTMPGVSYQTTGQISNGNLTITIPGVSLRGACVVEIM